MRSALIGFAFLTAALGFPIASHAATIEELLVQVRFLTAQIAALQAQQGTPAAPQSGAACPNLSRNLSRGMRGADVTQLQQFLFSQSHLTPDSVTGYFGPLTEAAVKQFQCRHLQICSGSPESNGHGAAGPRTRNAINNSCTTPTALVTTRPPTTNIIPPATTPIPATTVVPPTIPPAMPSTTLPSGVSGEITYQSGAFVGWAVNSKTPGSAVTVTFKARRYFKGAVEEIMGSISTNILRADINARYKITGNHGYSFVVPARYLDGNRYFIYASVDDAGSATGLTREPYVFADRGQGVSIGGVEEVVFDHAAQACDDQEIRMPKTYPMRRPVPSVMQTDRSTSSHPLQPRAARSAPRSTHSNATAITYSCGLISIRMPRITATWSGWSHPIRQTAVRCMPSSTMSIIHGSMRILRPSAV